MRPGEGLDALMLPQSIAVIGASQEATKIGGRPVDLLRRHGYAGRIYPVNPKAATVQGLKAYASVADLPEAPDLAIIAVDAERAGDAVEQCAARGVRSVVVFSSGFAELGAQGRSMQERLRVAARNSGMRLLGPNCLGAVSIAEKSIATFSIVLEHGMPAAGSLGIVSQSGNLGSYTMRLASERGVGVSRFITTGNECDIDIADGIAWMARDPATKVILCCLEACRDAGRLISALEEARDAGKPVIAMKIGTSEAGQAAAASHTGAMAGSDAVFDALFVRCGAVRVRSVDELIDLGSRRIDPVAGSVAEGTGHRNPHGVGRLRRAARGRRAVGRADLAGARRGDAAPNSGAGALCFGPQSGRRHRADVEPS
ncbi:acyl-CoA synthetase (NDP forming) [Bradyrhizobium huanghuaihaiense]